jgi:hypothetical protein
MVCYARPASRFAVLVIVALLVFLRPVSHFFDTAAITVAVAAATGGAAVASALVFAAFMNTRRRRAAAGGCVTCQFQCQHAMTERSPRLRLVASYDRSAPSQPTAAPVFLPMPAVRHAVPADDSAPRWPDRPARRVSHPVAVHPVAVRERAGSSV